MNFPPPFRALGSALLLLAVLLVAPAALPAAPKLGLQAWTFRQLTLLETIDQAAALGITHLQAYPGQKIGGDLPGGFTFTTPPADLEKILAHARAKNVSIDSFGVITPGKNEEWEKLFAFARAAGIREIVTEAPRETLLTLVPLAKKHRIDVSLHNHPKPNIYETPELALAAIDGLGARFGIAADTGHWARSGVDPVVGLKLVEKRLHSLHFKDIAERGKRSRDVPYGTGTSDLAGQLYQLRDSGFDGIAYIEYEHASPALADDVARCAAFFRAGLEASKKDLLAGRVAPAGFSTDVRATHADGRGKDSARWPAPQPLFAPDLSNADFTPGAWAVDAEGVLAPTRDTKAPHRGDIWTKANYGDFALNVEFRTHADGANSGVFLRSSDIVNWLHHSIEVQIFQGESAPVHATGAIFDVAAPRRRPTLIPGAWNRCTIIARQNKITVILNDEEVNKIDLDEWTQAGLNPDGTKNKFAKAYKDMARSGRIGLQDHGGSRVEFRHLFVERL